MELSLYDLRDIGQDLHVVQIQHPLPEQIARRREMRIIHSAVQYLGPNDEQPES